MGGANGALPAVRRFAEATARLSGGTVSVAQHTRLFEMHSLTPADPVPGGLRQATYDELELATEWFGAFMADADEQAGRTAGSSPHEVFDEESMRKRIGRGQLWFWLDEHGERVHLTGVNPPSFGVARIGPVYSHPASGDAAGPARRSLRPRPGCCVTASRRVSSPTRRTRPRTRSTNGWVSRP